MINSIDGALLAPRGQAHDIELTGGVLLGVSRRLKAAARFAYLLIAGPF